MEAVGRKGLGARPPAPWISFTSTKRYARIIREGTLNLAQEGNRQALQVFVSSVSNACLGPIWKLLPTSNTVYATVQTHGGRMNTVGFSGCQDWVSQQSGGRDVFG
jgi:hypothetical protein